MRMMSLLLDYGRAGTADGAAIRKQCVDQLSAARTIFQRVDVNRDAVARFQAVRLPSALQLPRGGPHLKRPIQRFSARLIQHENTQPAMRIGPFHLLDGPPHGDRLLRIEHGEGMMRVKWGGCGDQEQYCQGSVFQVHRDSPSFVRNNEAGKKMNATPGIYAPDRFTPRTRLAMAGERRPI